MLIVISVFYWIFTIVIQSPRFTNDYEFGISVSTYQYRSRHSNLNFAHHFIYWLFQNGVNKNQHQNSYQRETVPDKFIFFFQNWYGKTVNRVSKICVCVSDICAEGFFVSFPWWLKNVKSRLNRARNSARIRESILAIRNDSRSIQIWESISPLKCVIIETLKSILILATRNEILPLLKIARFQMSTILKFDFQKKRTIRFYLK